MLTIVASDRITFRFPIDKQFRADWDDFLRRARDADSTPSQTLQQLVIEYLNQQEDEDEADDEETDRQTPPESEKRKPARKVRKVHRKPPKPVSESELPVSEPELEEGALAQIIRRVRSASTSGGDVQQALKDAAQSALSLFSDLTGQLIYRALNLAH